MIVMKERVSVLGRFLVERMQRDEIMLQIGRQKWKSEIIRFHKIELDFVKVMVGFHWFLNKINKNKRRGKIFVVAIGWTCNRKKQ